MSKVGNLPRFVVCRIVTIVEARAPCWCRMLRLALVLICCRVLYRGKMAITALVVTAERHIAVRLP